MQELTKVIISVLKRIDMTKFQGANRVEAVNTILEDQGIWVNRDDISIALKHFTELAN